MAVLGRLELGGQLATRPREADETMLELFHRIAIRPQKHDRQQLMDTVQVSGGHIVQYERVASVVFYSELMPCVEWVPPGASRTVAGVKHALVSLLLGWWSPTGLLMTLAVVLNNLAGGVDITSQFVVPKTHLHEQASAALARDLKRKGVIVNLSFGAWVLFLVGVTFYGVRAN